MEMQAAEQLAEEVSIANRAMKAVFHRGVGAARRSRDLEAEALVRDQLGDQGQIVTKRLFTNKQGLIYKRNQLANEMYTYHIRATLPHTDDGARILPNKQYFEYTQTMGQFEQSLKAMDAQIIQDYSALIAADMTERILALQAQGKPTTGVHRDEYPSLDQMQRYLYVEWVLEPISTANDYRYQVDDAMKARLESRLKVIEEQAKADVFARMFPPMQRFIEKLRVPIGEKGSIFRDSLVENLNELAVELPKLNFSDDPRVDEMVGEVKRLLQPYVFNPDALREQPEARDRARERMEELMKKMDGYGWRRSV